MHDFAGWLVAGYLLTWMLIPWVLLKRSVHASAAVGWILSIIFLPYLGALLCAMFGATRWERRAKRKHHASKHIAEHTPYLTEEWLASKEELSDSFPNARLIAEMTGVPAVRGNAVHLMPDTHEGLQRIEEMIRNAKKWIHIEFYIWRNDSVGMRVRDLLIERAREGLEIRFLYDGFGSIQLSRSFLRPLKQAGVRLASFTPGLSLWHLLTLNLRNHRKLVVTDQQEIFTGGMNLGEEYVHPTAAYGRWRDTQLLLQGPAALQFQRVFAQDWFYATGEELTADEYYPPPRERGTTPAQMVADGPDDDVDAFYMLALGAIGRARHTVVLATPYFVPPEGLAVTLAAAAYRGVRVRIMVAERGNFVWTYQAGRSYYYDLLRAGVEIYEYGNGLFHSKTLMVDNQWCLVGTANWDFRSLILNFEVAVSLFDPALAEELARHFQEDVRFSRLIQYEEWLQRSRLRRLHEQFWNLFAPMF